jgi:glycosyltransferase involved in cell wall biosynthesis
MKLGVAINDTWAFFHEIYALFQQTHSTTLFQKNETKSPIFKERFNRRIYQQDLTTLLSKNQVVFFEWAGEYLAHATQLPKYCGIVTRLHRYELYQWASLVDWSKVDRLILVSHEKEKEILEQYPQMNGKTSVIPESVNLELFSFAPNIFRKQVGILCHLSPRKRVYELILAFAESNLFQSGYHLHIGGGKHAKFGDYYHAIHLLVQKLGVQKHITFYDHVDKPKEWFQKIDIFISNSYSEGLQVSPMEAMASGCFVLIHDWGGADELAPAENLYLTNREMTEKIHSIANLSEAARLEKLILLRRRVEENFDVNKISRKILNVVEMVGKNYS